MSESSSGPEETSRENEDRGDEDRGDSPRRSARARLVEAALELVAELGPRGATTRKISERAGVNEVTLFRHFGTKSDLVARALSEIARGFAGAALGDIASDDVEADLVRLAEHYSTRVVRHRLYLTRLITELRTDEKLRDRIQPIMQGVASRVVDLFEHHQRAGRLVDGDPQALAMDFLGPLLARVLAGDMLGIEPDFDAADHVRRYLEGHSAQG
jgi:AcrR family transcriptional regulator